MNGPDPERLFVLVDRELQTVVRTPTFAFLVLGFAAVVVGTTLTGGSTGGRYVPTTLDLLPMMELLVPVLAFAFGYRAVLADTQRGEMEMLRTYPVSKLTLALGVYVGRATALLASVILPLLVAVVIVVLTGGGGPSFIAQHAGGDSVLLYFRFVVLTSIFALVVLAVALAVSAASRSTREALALAVGFLVVLVIGLDLGIIAGLAGGVVSDDTLVWLLAASPNSAYRGLVLETVAGVVSTSSARAAAPAANLLGLAAWLVVSLAVAVRTVWEK
ncbi:ABC transporter permease subunit [Halobacteriaceae archaeon GCM10025711]